MIPDALSDVNYPNIDLADIGQIPNFGYGVVDNVRAHAIVGGATAFLASSVAISDTSIEVDHESRFPAAPFIIQVSYEQMLVTVKAGTTFTVTRAYNDTDAAEHAIERTVFEVLTEYVYLVSEEPVKSIDDIFVDGKKQSEDFTAYTGQAGDSHPDWPGLAVVAISVEAFIEKQKALSTDDASARETGESVTADIEAVSVANDLSITGNQKVWAAFALGTGEIKNQTYSVTINNPGGTDGRVVAVATDTATGAPAFIQDLFVSAGATQSFSLRQSRGNWETMLSILAFDEDMIVSGMSKTVVRKSSPSADSSSAVTLSANEIASDDRLSDGTSEGAPLTLSTVIQAWVSYDDTDLGDIVTQVHLAQIVETSGVNPAIIDLISADPDGTGRNRTRHTLLASESIAVQHIHSGGDWDTQTKVVLVSGAVTVIELTKQARYFTESILSDKSLEASASSRVVVGDDISINAQWAIDLTGDYSGLNNLIERPDHVIKHYLVDRMGFTLAQIDQTSFDAAGVLYAAAIAGGYKFGEVFQSRGTPSTELKRLAFEARSTVNFGLNKWFLNYIPDAAPAAVKTIDQAELAGVEAMFTFDKGNVHQIINIITALYSKNYLPKLYDGDWDGTIEQTDAASVTKYGQYKNTIEFKSIRDDVMMASVLAHVLLERKVPLLTVTFPVFYEHFDLALGNTIDISNGFFNGRKFYIEMFNRLDQFRATVTGREWWA